MKSLLSFLESIGFTALISLFALLLFVLPDFSGHLQFEFGSVAIWELHRVFGCHLLHWSAEHLFWDLAMFAVLGGLCERINRKKFLAALVATAILVPPVVSLFSPEASSYRGLSGIDTALFVLLATRLIAERFQERDWANVLVIGGFSTGLIVKITYEVISGGTWFVHDQDFTPLPSAHVAGALIGLAIALAKLPMIRPRPASARAAYQTMTERLDVRRSPQ